jgi:hypothetical protein
MCSLIAWQEQACKAGRRDAKDNDTLGSNSMANGLVKVSFSTASKAVDEK